MNRAWRVTVFVESVVFTLVILFAFALLFGFLT